MKKLLLLLLLPLICGCAMFLSPDYSAAPLVVDNIYSPTNSEKMPLNILILKESYEEEWTSYPAPVLPDAFYAMLSDVFQTVHRERDRAIKYDYEIYINRIDPPDLFEITFLLSKNIRSGFVFDAEIRYISSKDRDPQYNARKQERMYNISIKELRRQILLQEPRMLEWAGKSEPAEKSGFGFGTGAFISADGYILTAHHVIEGANKITVTDSSGKTYPARVVTYSEHNDVAVLKANVKSIPLPLISSEKAAMGDRVHSVGFPDPQTQGFKAKYNAGIISSLYGARDDAREFQISIPLQPGNSGGAVTDDYGNIIGVVSWKYNPIFSLATTGMLKENVSYAIKSSYVIAMIEGRDIKLSPASKTPTSAATLEKSTVLIVTEY